MLQKNAIALSQPEKTEIRDKAEAKVSNYTNRLQSSIASSFSGSMAGAVARNNR